MTTIVKSKRYVLELHIDWIVTRDRVTIRQGGQYAVVRPLYRGHLSPIDPDLANPRSRVVGAGDLHGEQVPVLLLEVLDVRDDGDVHGLVAAVGVAEDRHARSVDGSLALPVLGEVGAWLERDKRHDVPTWVSQIYSNNLVRNKPTPGRQGQHGQQERVFFLRYARHGASHADLGDGLGDDEALFFWGREKL